MTVSPYGPPPSAPLNAPSAAGYQIGIQAGSLPALLEVSTIIVVPGGANQGIFFYNTNPPKTGSLVGSWTQAAGVDPYGNSYDAGICIGKTNNTEIQIRPDKDAILIYAS